MSCICTWPKVQVLLKMNSKHLISYRLCRLEMLFDNADKFFRSLESKHLGHSDVHFSSGIMQLFGVELQRLLLFLPLLCSNDPPPIQRPSPTCLCSRMLVTSFQQSRVQVIQCSSLQEFYSSRNLEFFRISLSSCCKSHRNMPILNLSLKYPPTPLINHTNVLQFQLILCLTFGFFYLKCFLYSK